MEFITILYASTGIIMGLSFLPQILTLIRRNTQAKSFNLATIAMWSGVSIISVLYGTIQLQDIYFTACSAVAAVGNLSIFGLVLYRRLNYTNAVFAAK